MFESFDDNGDGIIDAGELSNALKYYKCVPFVLKWIVLQI
jgi:Ca2+-binding EF-hand superfamily protein